MDAGEMRRKMRKVVLANISIFTNTDMLLIVEHITGPFESGLLISQIKLRPTDVSRVLTMVTEILTH